MGQTKKIPAEAVELYNRFIHGEIDRRAFLRGAERFAVTGLTAAAIVEALMPNYALGQQVRKDDERIKGSYETIPSPNGHGYVRGYFVRPFSADTRTETAAKLPGVIIVHENRGLNPHTEDVARRFAKLDAAKRTQDFVAAARWLKSRPDCNGKIAATGFCFGGSMANNLAVLLGPDLAAAAPFYGGAAKPEDVSKIKAAILIHHGALDKNLVEAYPAQEAELKKNNIKYEGHIYPNSVHGFFNDATPERYNKVTAQQAWTRTIDWFNQYARA